MQQVPLPIPGHAAPLSFHALLTGHRSCSNDVFDAAMNVDGDKPESIVNLTGNRSGCFWVANAFLAAGVSLLFTAMQRTVCPVCLAACAHAQILRSMPAASIVGLPS